MNLKNKNIYVGRLVDSSGSWIEKLKVRISGCVWDLKMSHIGEPR